MNFLFFVTESSSLFLRGIPDWVIISAFTLLGPEMPSAKETPTFPSTSLASGKGRGSEFHTDSGVQICSRSRICTGSQYTGLGFLDLLEVENDVSSVEVQAQSAASCKQASCEHPFISNSFLPFHFIPLLSLNKPSEGTKYGALRPSSQ